MGPSRTPKALFGLVRSLEAGGGRCGFMVEQRAYQAHMTFARKVIPAPRQIVVQVCDWEVDHFVLLRSVSSAEGVYYEPLRQWTAR